MPVLERERKEGIRMIQRRAGEKGGEGAKEGVREGD